MRTIDTFELPVPKQVKNESIRDNEFGFFTKEPK